jgi:hypothetical protein
MEVDLLARDSEYTSRASQVSSEGDIPGRWMVLRLPMLRQHPTKMVKTWENSGNPHAMCDMCYDGEALVLFIVMGGHGQHSLAQYGLLCQVIGGVSERQIR